MMKFNPEERIYLIKRRHWLPLVMQLLPLFLFMLFIILSIFYLFFREISWSKFITQNFPEILEFNLKYMLIFFLSLFLPIFWTIIFLIIAFYYLTYWVVTNQRTIYVKLGGLFNFSSSSVTHDRIQDVTVKIEGIFPSFFHFGDLQIQTAGEFGQFLFYQIPDPEIVKQVIIEAQKDYLKAIKND